MRKLMLVLLMCPLAGCCGYPNVAIKSNSPVIVDTSAIQGPARMYSSDGHGVAKRIETFKRNEKAELKLPDHPAGYRVTITPIADASTAPAR